jgi:hypothetical protein
VILIAIIESRIWIPIVVFYTIFFPSWKYHYKLRHSVVSLSRYTNGIGWWTFKKSAVTAQTGEGVFGEEISLDWK